MKPLKVTENLPNRCQNSTEKATEVTPTKTQTPCAWGRAP